MSRALAEDKRIENDAYYTPPLLAQKLVNLLPLKPGYRVLEPHVGGGAFARQLLFTQLHVNDIDSNAAGLQLSRWPHTGSFLDYPEPSWKFDYVIGNPPFRGFEDHVIKAHSISNNVAFLLRLGALESKGRFEFWKRYPLKKVWVLSERPSFTDGGTDSAAYGFFWWERNNTTPCELEIVSWK